MRDVEGVEVDVPLAGRQDAGRADAGFTDCDYSLHGCERRPRLGGLGLDAAGVDHTDRGIVADDWGRTSVDGIWAIGDVTGNTFTTHGANAIGRQPDTTWLLGLPIMVCALVNRAGHVAEILAGTPDALRKRVRRPPRKPDGYPPRAELVVASLDGDSEQQTWPP